MRGVPSISGAGRGSSFAFFFWLLSCSAYPSCRLGLAVLARRWSVIFPRLVPSKGGKKRKSEKENWDGTLFGRTEKVLTRKSSKNEVFVSARLEQWVYVRGSLTTVWPYPNPTCGHEESCHIIPMAYVNACEVFRALGAALCASWPIPRYLLPHALAGAFRGRADITSTSMIQLR